MWHTVSSDLYHYASASKLLSIQCISVIDNIPTSDVELASFRTKHFLPIPTHDAVLEHFKQKVNMKPIHFYLWDAATQT